MQVIRGKGHGRYGVGVIGCCPPVERIGVGTGGDGRKVKVCPCALQKHYVDSMWTARIMSLCADDSEWYKRMVNVAAAAMLDG